MSTNVKIHADVQEEVAQLLQYISDNSGIDQSDAFFFALESVIQQVQIFPQMGARDYKVHTLEIRRFLLPHPFERYLLYWHVGEDVVTIFHIRHISREVPDIKSLFLGL